MSGNWWTRTVDAIAYAKAAHERAQPLPTWLPAPPELLIRPTTIHEAAAHARSQVELDTTYRLGGGSPVTEPSAFYLDGTSDCSGFTGWETGHNRIQHIGGHRVSFYTTHIIEDALGPQHMYELATGDDVLGCLVVKDGKWLNGHRLWPGHVGIIVEVLSGFKRGSKYWYRFLRVCHCTPNHGRHNSVRETDAKPWRKTGYIVRPKFYAGA